MSENQPVDPESHSITLCIHQLKQNAGAATAEIWKRFYSRLLPLARSRLRGSADPAVSEEDILVSVFDRFFRAVAEDRFADLHDRDDLWQILFMLTNNRIVEHHRRTSALKRGGGRLRHFAHGTEQGAELTELAQTEPDPQYLAAFNDTLKAAVIRLVDEKTREVALLKLEGYANAEISESLGISVSSVERKLRIVREAWSPLFGNSDE